ncbi:LOW QUALITY PROTEIN: FH2 domain-containing protein 1 [Puntigrus tetrazona]|uniref:LOW QUALITY PROTEIN: FH2 domain-containing protein 1 n=1 Tax=Puntigrus tetrazona TaxID=1606681 RepID=UPI001C8A61C0|nr:LOW QUALITY PROTEIN: FH2 domain-containing protein 1 [Puntigrus tetrazona]
MLVFEHPFAEGVALRNPDDVMQSASAAVDHLLAPPTSLTISSFEKEGGAVASPSLLCDHAPQSAPPLAPPLPPPFPVRNPAERKRRVRSFYWKPIPEDRVKQQRTEPVEQQGSVPHRHPSHRRAVWTRGHALLQRKRCDWTRRHAPVRRLRLQILDSKRSLNISIFLKHFKKSCESLLDDVLHGNTGVFSVESLRELLKLLPEEDEVKNLQMFSGNPEDLAPPDAFIHKLIHLPRYEVRLEALLLKEEFFPSYTAMKHDMSVILSAIKELMSCEELHNVLHLVLQAGNIMNAGGSAGIAVGFKLSSLLLLADTKANKPGVSLLHFVAQEAQKKDLLMFPEELQRVHQAARVCVDSIHEEFNTLTRRVDQLQQNVQTDDELLTQLQSFLESAGGALEDLKVSIDEVQKEGDALIDFFCEDRDVFRLDECFRIFQTFCSRFKKAVQENAERGMWEESRRSRLKESEDKRHSWAGHEDGGGASSLQSNSQADVAAALKREGFLQLLKTSCHSPRHSPQHESVTFDPCGSDTLVLPPIQSLSITNTTEEPEIQNKSLSTQEAQNNDLQTQSQETSSSVNSDASQVILVSKPEVIHETMSTKEPIKTSAGVKQPISKRTLSSKNRATLSAKSPSPSTKAPSSPSSSSSSPKCVSSSETASLRKLVPLRQDHSSSVLSRAKKTQAFRPEEKMCRVTLDRPSPQTSVKPLSFARNTVASTSRRTSAPGQQAKAAPLGLSQVPKPPAGTVRPPRKSSAATESSALARGSRDKGVQPTWR